MIQTTVSVAKDISTTARRAIVAISVPLLLYLSMLARSLFPSIVGNDLTIDSFTLHDILLPVPDILYIPATLLWIKWTSSLSPRDIGFIWFFGKMAKKDFLKVAICFLIGVVSFYIVAFNIYFVLGYRISFSGRSNLPVHNICYLLLPILEEVLFRGVMCIALSRWLGWGWAIVISSVSFTAIHFSPYGLTPHGFFAVLLLSFFFGWLFYKSRSLPITTFFHVSYNAFGLSTQVFPEFWNHMLSYVTFF